MKKLLLTVLSLSFLLPPSLLWGAACTAGTLALANRDIYSTGMMRILSATWVADNVGDVNGTSNCDVPIDGYVYMVVTDPGTGTAPTALYDITLSDSDGADVVEGNLADRSATVTEQVSTYIGGVPMARFVKGSLSVVVSNAGNAGEGEIIFYIYVE